MLGCHFGTYGLITMFHHEGLDSSKMAFIDPVLFGSQSCKKRKSDSETTQANLQKKQNKAKKSDLNTK